MSAHVPLIVNDRYAQMLSDAFVVLDRYFIDIPNRDPVKSLDEDRCELLRRVRAALEPSLAEGDAKRADVTALAQRIDDLLITECPVSQTAVPRMYSR